MSPQAPQTSSGATYQVFGLDIQEGQEAAKWSSAHVRTIQLWPQNGAFQNVPSAFTNTYVQLLYYIIYTPNPDMKPTRNFRVIYKLPPRCKTTLAMA